jgi:hypothetical protein
MDERPPHRPWEEDFGPEEQLLLSHGFHRVRGLDDVWQLGRAGVGAKDAKPYTREEALALIKERMNRDD